MQLRLGQALRAVAAALALGGLASAQAAVYTGQWDPLYGAPFNAGSPDLGWKGSAEFVVPDSCLTNGTVTIAACPGLAVSSAQVVFYEDVGNTEIATLNFVGSGINLFEVNLAGGDLVWVESQYSLPESPTNPFQNIDDYAFYLQFREEGVRLYHTLKVGGEADPSDCLALGKPIETCGFSSSYADIEFTRVGDVPEPGSLALVAAALGAGWAVRRRRQLG
ncbi:MAG: PEP-CTERM sorting domain-containing protein [Rubrivivax sp.]|nr:PEP-CTERM sorting domain-containing protein [Rubrivivax sp.]